MADPNTRQGKRTPVTLKIKFKSETLEQFIERYAVDVSQGGIFIRTKEPLAVGTQMRFEFQLRDASPLIAGEGTVVWTRENDPSRPAIAPGMGVRFDRLAEGSQAILERILAEKAKQAPQRSDAVSKPPMFTDTPTRVAPAPVQEALLGGERRDFSESHTPLPKPQPFHSDADEFPEEAFEEATKVRALDDLIAQTADSPGASGSDLFSGKPPDDVAGRRGVRADSTLADPPNQTHESAGTTPGFAGGMGRSLDSIASAGDSAPSLPSPPEPKAPRMLDTTPSPRDAAAAAKEKEALIAQNERMEKLAKTKIGMEPPVQTRRNVSTPPASTPVADLPRPRQATPAEVRAPQPSAPPVNAPHGERGSAGPVEPLQRPAPSRSKAPLVILLLLLVAAAGAAVWFFVLRDRLGEPGGSGSNVANNDTGGSGSGSAGSASAIGSDGSGSGSAVDDGSAGSAGSAAETPAGPIVDLSIAAAYPEAEIEVVGTDQKGPAPFTAKLEKGKTYQIRISAPGFATLEQEVTGGQDKVVAKLVAKPYVISVSSTPAGALILVNGAMTKHATPFDVELTKSQAARHSVRIGIRKAGYRAVDKVVTIKSFEEAPTKMSATIDERLAVQVQLNRHVNTTPHVDAGAGLADAGAGSGSATTPTNTGSGSGSAGTGSGSAKTGTGSGTTPPPGGGSATPPAGGGTTPPGGGAPPPTDDSTPDEPEPSFIKQTP